MAATLNRRMNLVVPIEREDGSKLFVHSIPVGRQVFEEYFIEIGKAYASIFTQGMGVVAGPRIGYLMLKKVSEETDRWPQVEQGFIREIVRLSNVSYMTEEGWKQIPLHTAIERQIITEDERLAIEGELVFFTLVQLMNKPATAIAVMNVVNGLWGSQLTSLDFSAYLSSLPTLMPEESSGETQIPLSVPH